MALNILIVDDSSVMRSIIIKTAKLSGINLGEIFQATNGEEGLRLLDANWIDVALIDIHMPVMDGQEMINHLRKNDRYKDLPVIVISSESDQKKIELLHRQGATFIHKPFTPETLKDVIVEAIGGGDESSN